jgi:hypothetical protein
MSPLLSSLVLSSLIALPNAAPESVDAVWVSREIEFVFLSQEVAYSCDLIESRLEMLLHHVGADEGADVTMPPCLGASRPQMRHRITARFSTLEPAPEDSDDTVEAAWQEVVLGKRHPPSIDDSDCMLIEHFRAYLLPAFEHEVTGGKLECGANRRSILGRLELRVLQPIDASAEPESEE